jgi:hypothetical protein
MMEWEFDPVKYHELKCCPAYFQQGRTCRAEILYILNLKEYEGIKGWAWALCRKLMPNLVILSIEVVE